MEKTKFEYKGREEAQFDTGWDAYELSVKLPDDGCPGSDQELIVRLECNPTTSQENSLTVIVRTGVNQRVLACTDEVHADAVPHALYGAARKVTKTTFEPV